MTHHPTHHYNPHHPSQQCLRLHWHLPTKTFGLKINRSCQYSVKRLRKIQNQNFQFIKAVVPNARQEDSEAQITKNSRFPPRIFPKYYPVRLPLMFCKSFKIFQGTFIDLILTVSKIIFSFFFLLNNFKF